MDPLRIHLPHRSQTLADAPPTSLTQSIKVLQSTHPFAAPSVIRSAASICGLRFAKNVNDLPLMNCHFLASPQQRGRIVRTGRKRGSDANAPPHPSSFFCWLALNGVGGSVRSPPKRTLRTHTHTIPFTFPRFVPKWNVYALACTL